MKLGNTKVGAENGCGFGSEIFRVVVIFASAFVLLSFFCYGIYCVSPNTTYPH